MVSHFFPWWPCAQRALALSIFTSDSASTEATWEIRAAGAQVGAQSCGWRDSVLGWLSFHVRHGGIGSPRTELTPGNSVMLLTHFFSNGQWEMGSSSVITGITVWRFCSDWFLKAAYQSPLTILGAWQYTYTQKISLLNDQGDRFLTGTLNHLAVAKHLLAVETSKLDVS